MAPTGGIGERYATQVGVLWSGLARALAELDQLAADPADLDDDAVDALRRLQYRLHTASEDVYGIAPPAGAEPAHAELAAALAGARDATADLVDALDAEGTDAASTRVHEWRGALFRVRLARLRLSSPEPRQEPEAEEPSRSGFRRALLAVLLASLGALAFATGATIELWPLWAAGLLAVCGSLITYKP